MAVLWASSHEQMRQQIAAVATSSFVDALNHITLIAMVIAFASAAVCFVTIRQQDFVQQDGH